MTSGNLIFLWCIYRSQPFKFFRLFRVKVFFSIRSYSVWLDFDEVKNLEPVNTEPDTCYGRLCARCGKCRDWYYIGDSASLSWLQNWKGWSLNDWKRYRDNNFSRGFKQRDNATCRYYFCIIDGDDLAAALHLHNIGADAGCHAHHDLCLCNENIRNWRLSFAVLSNYNSAS